MLIMLIIIFLVSFLAFSISAICGGGAGLMLIPILGRLLPIAQVPAALSIGTFTSAGSRLIIFRKNICWQIVKTFVPAALPAVWLGAWILKFVNPIYIEIVMGIFLISNLSTLFKTSKQIDEPEKPSKIILGLIGFCAGFLSGLTGAVGLLFNRFYLKYGLNKEEIIATRAANEIILHLIKIILYILFGLISLKVIYIGFVVALAAILSSLVMKWILPKLCQILFKKIGFAAMALSGCIILAQAGNNLVYANHLQLETGLINKGIETKLAWQNANYALEFSYDEGFEFEQIIPFFELSLSQQAFVNTNNTNKADKIIIETVYTMGEQSFEAYYFKNKKLVHKIDF